MRARTGAPPNPPKPPVERYYDSNEVYERRGVGVVLEGSSDVARHDGVRPGVLQKRVFHSRGDLCGDWVPDAQVVGNDFDP